MLTHVFFEFLQRRRALSSNGICLDILVEEFHRIELWTVAGDPEGANLVTVGFKPMSDFFRTEVNRMSVHDNKWHRIGVTDETPEEIKKHLRGETPGVHHEAKESFVGEGGQHINRPALPGSRHHGSLALPTVACTSLMIASQSRFIFPVDFSSELFCLSDNGRIFLLQPTSDGCFILLNGSLCRFLRRHTPFPEETANRPSGENRSTLGDNKFCHGPARPEHSRATVFFGGGGQNDVDNKGGDMADNLGRSRRPAFLLSVESPHSPQLFQLRPGDHTFPTDTENTTGF